MLSRLGKVPDAEIAAELGIRPSTVAEKRGQRGIPPPLMRFWTPEEDALAGTLPDGEIAKKVGRSRNAVAHRRRRLGLPTVPRRPARGSKP